jgi:hypothetical protein
METLTPIERAVLESTSQGAGSLEQIYWRLHESPMEVPLADTADAVESLVRRGLIEAESAGAQAPRRESKGGTIAAELVLIWRVELAVTPRGRELLTAGGEEMEAPSAKSADEAGPSLFGIWKDLGIRATREDIDEVRREMWANFPRDEPK